jgi:hypothetical protein
MNHQPHQGERKMRIFRWFLPLSLILFSTSIARADVITFEGLSDSTSVNTQYLNLVFSNATAITSDVTLNEFEFPPNSGVNVVFDDGGPMSITFTTPVLSVGGYFTYSTRITIVAYDAANIPIATMTSAFDNNEALSGDPGSQPNEFIVFSMPSGISRITITGSLTGSSFVMDDLTFTAIPEPGTIFLLLTGSGMLAAFRKRFHR